MKTETILKTSLAFDGGSHSQTPRAIELCLVLTSLKDNNAKACFSVKSAKIIDSCSYDSPFINASPTGASHRPPVNTSRILNSAQNRSRDMDESNGSHTSIIARSAHHRRTIAHAEYIFHSEDDRENDPRNCMVRLLRVALEHPIAIAAGRYSNVLLSIEISEQHRYAPLAQSDPDGSSSEHTGDIVEDGTSNHSHKHSNVSPSSTRLPVSVEDADTPYARRDSADTLQNENETLRSQIAGLSTQNAVLSSQMQDMSLKMSAMLARLDAITSPEGGNSFPIVPPLR